MKRKLFIAIAAIAAVATLMFAEYRFIMENLHPYRGANGTVYIEIFGNVDKYYAENAAKMFLELE